MNEISIMATMSILEGILFIIVGISAEVLALVFHMALPNPGFGGFQAFMVIYGGLKISYGVYIMREWTR